jgi:predicted RNase H-like nuclease (RuvC/YqgF family)
MKTNSFFLGAVLGAAATVALTKKFFNCCSCEEKCDSCDNSVPKEVDGAAVKKETDEAPEKKDSNATIEQLRNSIESLRKELSSRIESEQTFAAKCEDLKEQVAKQSVEINNLKNVCEMQDSRNKKLEEELANKPKK